MPKPRVTKREAPSIKEQALELKSLNNNKNSVRIQTQDKKIHYDLDGASHKGVETPHVQTSYPNTNPNTGQTFWNKDNSAAGVKPMTQQDIRTVRKYLEKKDSN
nr:polymorphic toxin type 24 domain-containing protein [Aliikangiella sp. G2MR2-5]